MLRPKRKKISELRRKKSLSMNKLSKMSGLSSCSLHRIENGIGTYTHPIRARAIAESLGCEVMDIFEEV